MTAVDWTHALVQLGLSPDAATHAGRVFKRVEQVHRQQYGTGSSPRAWWIPGRIEVLGKHTDYGGGRSLLCAVERGFHVVASPRADRLVNIVDASTRSPMSIPLDADTPSQPGRWSDYPISVARRVARDFPAAATGMDFAFESSLPSASGLSSSSALVIAVFLPLAAFNALATTETWSANIADDDAVAEYLGAVENGRAFAGFPADRGVGTQGGCEDHVAILRAQPGALRQYHFIPATPEATVPLPAGWEFVIAMSGVHAAKGGAVQQQYNALSAQVVTMQTVWHAHTGRAEPLFQAMTNAPDAGTRLDQWLADDTPDAVSLRQRLQQFRDEAEVIIPGVVQGLRARDMARVGRLVAQSQSLAETALRNQVDETIHLARRARELGAAAASAFGAGFGGSVWALVRSENAKSFMDGWLRDYRMAFPDLQRRAVFFRSAAGPPAHEVCR